MGIANKAYERVHVLQQGYEHEGLNLASDVEDVLRQQGSSYVVAYSNGSGVVEGLIGVCDGLAEVSRTFHGLKAEGLVGFNTAMSAVTLKPNAKHTIDNFFIEFSKGLSSKTRTKPIRNGGRYSASERNSIRVSRKK